MEPEPQIQYTADLGSGKVGCDPQPDSPAEQGAQAACVSVELTRLGRIGQTNTGSELQLQTADDAAKAGQVRPSWSCQSVDAPAEFLDQGRNAWFFFSIPRVGRCLVCRDRFARRLAVRSSGADRKSQETDGAAPEAGRQILAAGLDAQLQTAQSGKKAGPDGEAGGSISRWSARAQQDLHRQQKNESPEGGDRQKDVDQVGQCGIERLSHWFY